MPSLLLDGGLDALGPEGSWRCPQMEEISFATCRFGEGCCVDFVRCEPVQMSAPFDAGAGGNASEPKDGEQLCCYYTTRACGV